MGKKITPANSDGDAGRPAPSLKDIYERELVSKRHNCTDIICLILFVVFGLVQAGISLIIFINGGDPSNILLPHDSNGNLCTGSKPNLFYFNLAACLNINALITSCQTPTICVAQCPSDNYYYMLDSHRSILYKSYCKADYSSANSIPSIADYSNLIGNLSCPAYALSSRALLNRCLPSVIFSFIDGMDNALYANDTTTNQTIAITDSTGAVTDKIIKQAAQYITTLLNIKTIAQFIFEDFVNAWPLIVILLVIAAIVSFIYIVILRWVVGPFIYFSLLALVGGLSFAVYFCFTKYVALKSNNGSIDLKADINYYLSLGVTWLVIGIIASIILFIVLLIILVLIKRLRLAIQLLREASRATSSVFLTLIFPVFPLLLKAGFLAYFIANAVILACSGKAIYRNANSTNVSVSCDPGLSANGIQCLFYKYGFDYNDVFNQVMGFLSNYQWAPQLYNVFMLFWTQAFLVGYNQMVLAGSFGIWYWSQSRSSCILFTSIKDTMVYHMGSIAFGSLLIAICKFIRFMIEFVERRVKSATGNRCNCLISFIACCCKCCLWCLEKFLKFLNRNAYIMVAIYGRNFCRSARDAILLLAANPLRALVLNRVTDFILILGRLLITVGVGVLAFYFFSKNLYVDPSYAKVFAPDLHYYWVPLITVIIGAFFISKTFFTVFEMAVDTIFLCAMKDLDVHDGSAEKPYFMSTKMLKILDVKNKDVPREGGETKTEKF